MLGLLLATAVAAKAAGVPRDFRITIEDHAARQRDSFDTTISADGTVQQRVLLNDGWHHRRAVISQAAVSQLFDVIEKQRFFSLAANYPTDAFDCDTFVISIRANGRSHRVRSATCLISRGTKAE